MNDAITHDRLFGGAVALKQPARGYRVNVDSLLLAGFAAARRVSLLVDLGAGVGAVALAVNHLTSVGRAVLVERDAELAALARQNLADNALSGTVHQLDLDGRRLPKGLVSSADLVVSNPPFFDAANGRVASDPRARAARFGGIEPFVRSAAKLLSGPRARACFCYPARSIERLFGEAEAAKLVVKRVRFVHASTDAAARLALVELRRARPGGLVVDPPLVEWSAPQTPSPELSLLLARRANGRR